jgi:hypothetical protein
MGEQSKNMEKDIKQMTYKECIDKAWFRTIYDRMVDREIGSFSMENFPKGIGEETEYFVNNFDLISNQRTAVRVYSKDQKDLFMREFAHMIVLTLNVGNSSWTYQIVFI